MIAHPVQSDPASCVRRSKVEAGSLSCGSFIVFLSPQKKMRERERDITLRKSLRDASVLAIFVVKFIFPFAFCMQSKLKT